MTCLHQKEDRMEDNILVQYNREIRKCRPLINEKDSCEIFQTNSVLEISLSRGRCANDARGACIMCNYGEVEKSPMISSYLENMKQALDNCGQEKTCLMLCTNGSIFDERQIERELLERAIDLAAQCHIPHIEFETHYQDVTKEKLQLLQTKLNGKEIIIAMGLETINQSYQDCIFAKGIQLSEYKEKIDLIQTFGFQIELNIMVGLPFLSTQEQFKDACNTINWAFSQQCRPVLFPINIKPYSLLKEMYDTGHYKPISHWLLLLVLNTLTADELEQIILVWYGNRTEYFGNDQLKQIFPTYCDKCKAVLDTFYTDFINASSGKEKKQILYTAINASACDCLKNVQCEIENNDCSNFHSRYKAYETYLKEKGRRKLV